MQGHLHSDGLIHLVVEEDVGWLEPLYAFVSLCGVIHGGETLAPGNYVSTVSGHKASDATCVRCVAKGPSEDVRR